MASLASGFDTLARGAGGDPFGYQARLQAQQAQPALIQAQTGEAQQRADLIQQQAEEAKRALADEDIQRQAMKDANGDPDQFIRLLAKNGARPATVFQAQQNLFTTRQNALKLSADQRSDLEARHEQYRGILEGVLAAPADQKQAAWEDALQRGAQVDPQDVQGMPQQYPGDDFVTQHHNAIGMAGSILKEANEKATGAKTAADTSKAKAESDKAAADAAHQQMINDLMKQAGTNPQAGVTAIKTALPDGVDDKVQAGLIAAYQGYMAAGKPDEAAGVVKTASEHMASLSPAKTQAEVDKAVAVKKATLPLEVAQAAQIEIQKARMAGGIGQIVDPQQRSEASRTLDAADKEALEKISAADSLKNTVNMALAGNKLAPNLETIEELRSIVNRVNRNELEQVGGAGSAYDRAAGFLGKWTNGQPIPDNIQKDFLAVANGQQQIAQAKHAAAYGTVAARFGVKNLQPPDIAGIYSNARGAQTQTTGNAGAKKISTRADFDALPKGTHYIDPGDGKEYIKP